MRRSAHKVGGSGAPLLAGAIVLILALVAWYFTTETLAKYDKARFRSLSAQIEHEISTRMQTYVNTLVQTKSMFAVTHEVDRREFAAYIESLKILDQYPGIQGIGFTQRILRKDLKQHVQSVRAEGFANYHVWPDTPRPEYFSIVYLEPFDWRNQRAFGYDMFTDPIRREAMARARDSGEPAVSEKVVLVQEVGTDKQYGFLLFVPVYKNQTRVDTLEERRRSLMGFIYSPFRSRDLFNEILSHDWVNELIEVSVYTGPENDAENLIYRHSTAGSKSIAAESALTHVFSYKFGGREWRIVTKPLPAFYQDAARAIPVIILVLGIVLSGLIYWIVYRHEKLAVDEHERVKQVETLNQIGKVLSAELDLERLVQAVTDAGRELSKGQFGAFFFSAIGQNGEGYSLYTTSGIAKDEFSKVPIPSFRSRDTVRSDDITKDPRYGPKGHLPVRSYLAVSVISRTGEVIGGLLYGHERAGVFDKHTEKLVEGLASQAAIAVDNARLFQKSKEAISSRDEFLSIASHELKTPLTSLKMQLQMTRRSVKPETGEVPTAQKLARVIDVSNVQVNRLTALIDDLLDVSRIQAGRLSYNFEQVDVSALAREMAERFAEQFRSAGCEIQLRVEDHVTVCADRFRLEQVILNLLTNASKYGAGKPVEILVRQMGQSVRLEVCDHGIGIAPDKLDKVFDRFERAISSNNISGLGLGLFITREIVNGHQGKIWVESKEGVGSTFIVELPLAISDHVAQQTASL